MSLPEKCLALYSPDLAPARGVVWVHVPEGITASKLADVVHQRHRYLMESWKVDAPQIDFFELPESVDWNAEGLADRMKAPLQVATLVDGAETLKEEWYEGPQLLHLAVKIRGLVKRGGDQPLRENEDEKAHRLTVQAGRDACAPSVAVRSAGALTEQQQKHPIYIGRPGDLMGPPIAIYAPSFAEIQESLKDLSKQTIDHNMVKGTAELFVKSADLYADEKARQRTVQGVMERLLNVKFATFVKAWDGSGTSLTESDAALVVETRNKGWGHVVDVEFKNELGNGGNGAIQGPMTVRKQLITPKYERTRKASCCPCIIITVAGPYLCFSGSVFVDIFIAQPFTDYIYVGGGPQAIDRILHVARIFRLFRTAIADLSNYYRELEVREEPLLSRLMPCPSYKPKVQPPVPLPRFLERFRPQYVHYARPLFVAELGGQRVLIKFSETYCEEAHTIVAALGLAPKLHFVAELCGGMKMVIMDLIAERDVSIAFPQQRLPDSLMDDLEKAIGALHAQGYVHGDLRRPNVVAVKSGASEEWGACVIDFDWAGLEHTVKYPPMLNTLLDWPEGVAPWLFIKKEHDRKMLSLIRNP